MMIEKKEDDGGFIKLVRPVQCTLVSPLRSEDQWLGYRSLVTDLPILYLRLIPPPFLYHPFLLGVVSFFSRVNPFHFSPYLFSVIPFFLLLLLITSGALRLPPPTPLPFSSTSSPLLEWYYHHRTC